ncbi:uncharacterized protein LOC143245141 isoform X2 [Tachypleus tridentatus]|uniref:uncharacterized protein LOC143245141 isoform X2 n=1 Tax=Tachypleus tridentatus TaxID=6853 RepID=UPI003FD30847
MGDITTENIAFSSINEGRPQSDQLSEIHVYLVPKERWIETRKLAKNQVMDYAISSGFIRVLPTTNLTELRKVIHRQLSYDVVPKNYVFLRSVGRNFTQVKPHQEKEMKAKHFLPPFAPEPEIYLKEGLYVGDPNWSQGEDSGVEETLDNKSQYSEDTSFGGTKGNYIESTTQSNNTVSSKFVKQQKYSTAPRSDERGKPRRLMVSRGETDESNVRYRRKKGKEAKYKLNEQETGTRKEDAEENYFDEDEDENVSYDQVEGEKVIKNKGIRRTVNNKSHELSSNRRVNNIPKSQSKSKNGLPDRKRITKRNESKVEQHTDQAEAIRRERMSSQKYQKKTFGKQNNNRQNTLTNSNSVSTVSKGQLFTEDSKYNSPSKSSNEEYIIEKTSIKLLDADGNNATGNEISEIVQYVEDEERDPEVESGTAVIREHVITLDDNGSDAEEGNKYIVRKIITETREERTEKRRYRHTVNDGTIPASGDNGGDEPTTFMNKNEEEWIENKSSEGKVLDQDSDHENNEERYASSVLQDNAEIKAGSESSQTQRGRLKIEVSVKELGETMTQTDSTELENMQTETEIDKVSVHDSKENYIDEDIGDSHTGEAVLEDGTQDVLERDGDGTRIEAGEEDINDRTGDATEAGKDDINDGTGDATEAGEENINDGAGDATEGGEENINDGTGDATEAGEENINDGTGDATEAGEENINDGAGDATEGGEENINDGAEDATKAGEENINDGAEDVTEAGEENINDGAEDVTEAGEENINDGAGDATEAGEENINDGAEDVTEAGEENINDGAEDVTEAGEENINDGAGDATEAGEENINDGAGDATEAGEENINDGAENATKAGEENINDGAGDATEAGEEDINDGTGDGTEAGEGDINDGTGDVIEADESGTGEKAESFEGDFNNGIGDLTEASEGDMGVGSRTGTREDDGQSNTDKAGSAAKAHEGDFGDLEVEKLHDEEGSDGVDDQIEETVKNNRKHKHKNEIFARKNGVTHRKYEHKNDVSLRNKLPENTYTSRGSLAWAVDGNGRRWYYRRHDPRTKRGRNAQNELPPASQRGVIQENDGTVRTKRGKDTLHGGPGSKPQVNTQEQDFGWTSRLGKRKWRPRWTSDGGYLLRRSRSDGYGLARLPAMERNKKGDINRVHKTSSTLELLRDDEPLSRRERLQLMLEELKAERRLLDAKRQEYLRRANQLKSKANRKKDQTKFEDHYCAVDSGNRRFETSGSVYKNKISC